MRKPKHTEGILCDPKIRDRDPTSGCSLMGHHHQCSEESRGKWKDEQKKKKKDLGMSCKAGTQ